MASFSFVWTLVCCWFAQIVSAAQCLQEVEADGIEIASENLDGSSLLQTKADVYVSSSHTEQSNGLGSIVPVDKLSTARGTLMEPTAPDLSSEEYVLSKTAAEFGINADNAFLEGGGKELKLFPAGKVPEELPGDAGPQIIQPNDPGDRCSGGDVAGFSIVNVSEPSVVQYIVPKSQIGRKPMAVIIAPGGGSRFLSWNKEGTEIAKWLNSIGVSAFVLKYRVPCNTFETAKKPLIDTQRAVSLVRSKSKDLDFHSVGVIGFSAGGYILTAESTIPERQYKNIDAIDEHSSIPDFAMLIYGAGGDHANPALAPPTFIVLARDDPCVNPEGVEAWYHKALESGAEHELHIFGAGHHGYGDCSLYVNGDQWQPVCAWTVNAQLFMEKQLGVTRQLGQPMVYDDSLKRTAE